MMLEDFNTKIKYDIAYYNKIILLSKRKTVGDEINHM